MCHAIAQKLEILSISISVMSQRYWSRRPVYEITAAESAREEKRKDE
jgi:hypothetical protein